MTDKSTSPKASEKVKFPMETKIEFLNNDLKAYLDYICELEKENKRLSIKLAVYKEYLKRNVFTEGMEDADTDTNF